MMLVSQWMLCIVVPNTQRIQAKVSSNSGQRRSLLRLAELFQFNQTIEARQETLLSSERRSIMVHHLPRNTTQTRRWWSTISYYIYLHIWLQNIYEFKSLNCGVHILWGDGISVVGQGLDLFLNPRGFEWNSIEHKEHGMIQVKAEVLVWTI